MHPFDDPDVIAGQGTVAVEILRQTGGHLDAVFVPVGGGGLLAGIAVYVKYLYPAVKVIGVEPQDAASMHDSLEAGRRVTLERVGIFADGVAVRRVGEETFALSSRPARWRWRAPRNTWRARAGAASAWSPSTAAPT